MTQVDRRLNPDELLARVQNAEQEARRGKLKIFFGASPGVGKTYAMLLEARRLRWLVLSRPMAATRPRC